MFRLSPDSIGAAVPVEVDVPDNSIATASALHPLQLVVGLILERVVAKPESYAALEFRLSPDTIGAAIPVEVAVSNNSIARVPFSHPLQLVIDLIMERVVAKSESCVAFAFRLSSDTIGAGITVEADVPDER